MRLLGNSISTTFILIQRIFRHIVRVRAHTNERQVCSWVVHLICVQTTNDERRAVFGCLLRAAMTCWNIGNFNGAMQITTGLRYVFVCGGDICEQFAYLRRSSHRRLPRYISECLWQGFLSASSGAMETCVCRPAETTCHRQFAINVVVVVGAAAFCLCT